MGGRTGAAQGPRRAGRGCARGPLGGPKGGQGGLGGRLGESTRALRPAAWACGAAAGRLSTPAGRQRTPGAAATGGRTAGLPTGTWAGRLCTKHACRESAACTRFYTFSHRKAHKLKPRTPRTPHPLKSSKRFNLFRGQRVRGVRPPCRARVWAAGPAAEKRLCGAGAGRASSVKVWAPRTAFPEPPGPREAARGPPEARARLSRRSRQSALSAS